MGERGWLGANDFWCLRLLWQREDLTLWQPGSWRNYIRTMSVSPLIPTGLPSQPTGSSSHSRAGDPTLVHSRNPLPDMHSKHALLSHIHPSVLSGLIVPASCDGAQLCSRHRGRRYQRILYPRPAWATVGDCSLKKWERVWHYLHL